MTKTILLNELDNDDLENKLEANISQLEIIRAMLDSTSPENRLHLHAIAALSKFAACHRIFEHTGFDTFLSNFTFCEKMCQMKRGNFLS